jgi:tetratricopeptide (TPR) repeat protein
MVHSAAGNPSAGKPVGGPMPTTLRTYYVFLASPGDVQEERRAVRAFLYRFNRNQARFRGLRFEVVDWENYSSAGIGRPQELITQQTLERFRPSLALVIGIMAQRFGSPSGTHESGTEEEFEWAVESWRTRGYPEVKWYFRKVEGLQVDPDPDKALAGVEQWRKVRAFRARMDETQPRLYTREYRDLSAFKELLDQDLGQWLNAPERPWSAGPPGPDRPLLPDYHLIRLARRLDDAFVEQMRTGESVDAAQATARYVPMVFRARKTAGPAHEGSGPSEGPLEEFLAAERRLLVVGGGGSGKTTTLRHVAAQAADRALADPQAPVPVYVRLNSFDSPEDGLAALLRLIGVALDLDPAQAEGEWRSGERPLLFLFDGLNEVPRAYRETCTRALLTIVQGPDPLHRYVVTTRPGGPLEQIAGHPTEGSGLVVLELLDMRPDQVRRYVTAQGRADYYERIRRHVEGLASSPFLLWAVTRALDSAPSGTAADSRGDLFRNLIDYYIYEVRERGKAAPRPTTYNYALVKKPVLARLALRMSGEERTAIPEDLLLWRGVLAHLREIEETYEGILEFVPEVFMPADRTAAGLLDEVVDNGVLIREAGTLRFLHESVQEYFAAVALLKEPAHALAARGPESSLGSYYVRNPAFEVLVTLAGLLDRDAAGSLAVALLSRNPLLAAHVAREAELGGAAAEPLWSHYAELLDSRHEGRRKLGLRCLSVFPCSRRDVVARLIDQLGQSRDVLEAVAEALTNVAADDIRCQLVDAYLDGDLNPGDDGRADVLQKIGRERPAQVATQLLSAWRSRDEPGRQRLAELARYVDGEFRYTPTETGSIHRALLRTAVDAEVAGDSELASDADELRRRLRDVPLRTIHPTFGQRLLEMERLRTEAKKRIKALDDHELGELVRSGGAQERDLAFRELASRGSARTAELAIDCLIDGNTLPAVSGTRWWQMLAAVPEPVVIDALARRANDSTTAGSRARTVRGLLQHRPDGSLIDHVFRAEDQGLRALAAYAARRSPSALDGLAKALRREPSRLVAEAALDGLSTRGEPATTPVLLDLLFQGPPSQDGPGRDPAQDWWFGAIHRALVTAGARTAALERARAAMDDPAGVWIALGEVGRWLPDDAAHGILEQAAQAGDVEVSEQANWFLASHGDVTAWRRLLVQELETPTDVADFGRRQIERMLDGSPRAEQFLIAAREMLVPVLQAEDGRRKAAALEIACRLMMISTDPVLLAGASSATDELGRAPQPAWRATAVTALLRLRPDGGDLPPWLLEEDDAGVQEAARDAIGRSSARLLMDRLREAIRTASPQEALRLVRLLPASDLQELALDLLREFAADDPPQLGTALAALEARSLGFPDGDLSSLKNQVFPVLTGPDGLATWRHYCRHVASLAEHRLGAGLLAAVSEAGNPERLAALAEEAARCWPADPNPPWYLAWADLRRGRTDEAMTAFRQLADEDPADINHIGLALAFCELEDLGEALRHARLAVEQNDRPLIAHHLAGWYAYLVGELDASIESSRRAIELDPAEPASYANLGLALLRQGHPQEAWLAYRRFAAVVRRSKPEPAIRTIEEALTDLDNLDGVAAVDADTVARVRALIEEQRS